MRELKFRAYDKGRKEFLSAGTILLAINPKRNPATTDFYLDLFRESEKNTYKERFDIQQYTGLKDKNGKKQPAAILLTIGFLLFLERMV